MDKITEIINSFGETHVLIDHGNDQFTSMLKSHYDELKANEAETI